MSEQRGQQVDPAGVARMPLPTPEPPNIQAMYSDLMKEYNLLYSTVRNVLMDTGQLGKDEVPETDVLARLAADVIRKQSILAEEGKAERERWTQNENRWRALDMMAKYHSEDDATSWIVGARNLCRAVESSDFVG